MRAIIANNNPILSLKLKSHFNSSNFYHIEEKDSFTIDKLKSIEPDFIFFPHWSYIIQKNIFENYNCIVFHMTNLPFGRGGSPLQNLISRKIYETKISAIKVVEELDAGPIYLKKDFCLYGNAEEIYLRAGDLIIKMIGEIIETTPKPVEQHGSPVVFKRRTPNMSTIEQIKTIEELFDYIRMLDAEGYPKAFLENENFRFEFSRASLKSNNTIIADVRILKNKRILVIVAHPDDELLGCGATMHKLINEQNCSIRAIILGEGITSRSDTRDVEKWKSELEKHRSNIQSAANHIGYESVGLYDFPDNRFDTVALLDIVKTIEKEKGAFQPEIIFTHHGGDLNIDHQRTFEAVITACRPMANENVKGIITFETPSGTEWRASSDPKQFIPNLFIEISEQNLDAKLKGMESYEFERRLYPHPKYAIALKILAQRYGIMMGGNMYEAFQIIRLNVK